MCDRIDDHSVSAHLENDAIRVIAEKEMPSTVKVRRPRFGLVEDEAERSFQLSKEDVGGLLAVLEVPGVPGEGVV